MACLSARRMVTTDAKTFLAKLFSIFFYEEFWLIHIIQQINHNKANIFVPYILITTFCIKKRNIPDPILHTLGVTSFLRLCLFKFPYTLRGLFYF